MKHPTTGQTVASVAAARGLTGLVSAHSGGHDGPGRTKLDRCPVARRPYGPGGTAVF